MFFFAFLITQIALGQGLSVDKIMQDPKIWIGTSPSNLFWSEDSKTLYFSWNPDKNKGDSLYKITIDNRIPTKVLPQERRALPSNAGVYNKAFSKKLYTKNGDIFLMDCGSGQVRQLTNTNEAEQSPRFANEEKSIVFIKNTNLFLITIATGELSQITNFQTGNKRAEAKANEQEKWLKQDQLALFEVLKERADKKKEAERIQKIDAPKRPKDIYTDDKQVDGQVLSPDGRFVSYRLNKAATAKGTIIPNYVTESGFTEDIPGRSKVGYSLSSSEFLIYDTQKDTVKTIDLSNIQGIKDLPDYAKEAKKDTSKKAQKIENRKVIASVVSWNEDGSAAVVWLRSFDNKDRWLMKLDAENAKLSLLDRQRDEAWIGGPGTGFGFGGGTQGWLNNDLFYYQSEADGYSHLYTVNVKNGQKQQLTKGQFEVQSVELSRDKKTFYLTTNEVHPGEQHFYRMDIITNERIRLTKATGGHQALLSPNEKSIASLYSYTNKPWELYLQDNRAGAEASQITKSLSADFQAYSWRDPKVISFKASDGVDVYARVYEPKKKNKAAVIFVHGAGYLQNAHKWWSSYFREYQFHNLLADLGYTVIDIDYRASAGYGRNHRTGIYRFMGGKDLNDHLDAAKYLTEKYGIDPKRIGIYGGSYGGFITLMAMFTSPDTFKAGAALRPVTDWAAYNHGYTSNILNEPFTDSLAYRKSSPIYHAAGLKGKLLICHGLVDVNVHIQDSFRLAQRLMELKKENWELAIYPVEDHGFVEPSSWTDEYKRILKLFEGL